MLYQEFDSTGTKFFRCTVCENFNFASHIHIHSELIYVMEGELLLETEKGLEKISEGEFALILPNQVHGYRTENSSKTWIGVFSGDWIRQFLYDISGKRGKSCVFSCDKATKEFILSKLINAEYEPPEEYTLKSCFYAVCGSYLKNTVLDDTCSYDDSLMHQILEYVSARFRENITLEKMSQELGYEQHYVSRYFHKNVKMNFRKFLNQYRVSYAKGLLLQSGVTISQAAMESGFQNVRSFNRALKDF